MRSTQISFLIAWLSGCSSGIDLGARADVGTSDATRDAASSPDAASRCACSASEACLTVAIERSADSTQWTWVRFPGVGADGVGTLVMGLFGSSFRVAQRVAVPDFNLVGSARVELAFGCVQPGNYQFTGFLDDNGNASSTSIQSADYRDSCPPGDLRMTQAITMEAGIARSVTLVLGQTCD